MRSSLRVIALALACLGGALCANAQEPVADPYETTRFRFGPLGVTPSIALSNLGIDDNVFNEAVDPRQDTTAAIGPAAFIVFRAGRSRLSGNALGQYLYFQKYDNQRSWNRTLDGTWRFPLARLTPFVLGAYTNTKERPGFEIDARARRRDQMVGFGSDLRLSAKTIFTVTGKRSWMKYDDTEQFLGVNLGDRLNRHTDTEELQGRFVLTPLTTFVVRAQAVQDRFATSTLRNADSYSVMPGFELRPQALISGEVFVGVRRFTTLSDQLPDYTGLVAAVKATYTVAATRVGVKVARDVDFSFEAAQPYYALTDVGLDVTERITRGWDVVVRGGRQTLAYKNAVVVTALPERVDHAWMGGGGLGYRLGPTVRLGLDANYYKRTVDTNGARDYKGLRVGASISYGLPQ